MRLSSKIVLVTASTRGIGYACAAACVREGARVFMAARSMEKAEALCQEFVQHGYCVTPVYHDAKIPESYASMMAQVKNQAGRLDVLINNFGISDPRRDLDFSSTPWEVFHRTVTDNLQSVYRTSQAALPLMTENGGSIINISSIGGQVPDLSQIGYGTSKAAINYLTRLMAVQLAARHIRVNAVLPGMTATDAVQEKLTDEFRSVFLRHIPLGRMGLPEEIAQAAVYFAADESAYTTGQLLTVSGGFGLGTPLYADFSSKERAN